MLPASCNELLEGKLDEGFAELLVWLVRRPRQEVIEDVEERHVGEFLKEGGLEGRGRDVVALR